MRQKIINLIDKVYQAENERKTENNYAEHFEEFFDIMPLDDIHREPALLKSTRANATKITIGMHEPT
jgi:hypothetical protein